MITEISESNGTPDSGIVFEILLLLNFMSEAGVLKSR